MALIRRNNLMYQEALGVHAVVGGTAAMAGGVILRKSLRIEKDSDNLGAHAVNNNEVRQRFMVFAHGSHANMGLVCCNIGITMTCMGSRPLCMDVQWDATEGRGRLTEVD